MSYQSLTPAPKSSTRVIPVGPAGSNRVVITNTASFGHKYDETTETDIEDAIATHGVTPGGSAMLKSEEKAARESLSSGVYIMWAPHPSKTTLTSAAFEGIRDGTSQCARVGADSLCLCGHSLSQHKKLTISKSRRGYIKPPVCAAPGCRKCGSEGFSYCPSRPEEVGQWWLPRRKNFSLKDWVKRVQEIPEEYCCLGCEQRVSEHETIFEYKADRASRGAAIDEAYVPLHDNPWLSDQVLGEGKTIGGRPRERQRQIGGPSERIGKEASAKD